MQALRKEKQGPGHVQMTDVPVPKAGPDQVQIAVQAAGICGTDVHIYHDTFPYVPPVILGHEFSGQVTAVGDDVSGIEVGDRVMAETTAVLCGTCRFCQSGRTNSCAARRVYGVHVDGGFTEFAVVRQAAIHHLPDNVDYIAGAMTEPLAVCVHALIERARVAAGDIVLVTGPGPIGLLAGMVAKAHGATVIIAGTAKDATRLELARTVGADLTVKVDEEDLWERIQPFCEDHGGVDITVEASGASPAVEAGYRCTRKGGTILQLGLFEGAVTVDYSQIAFRELSVIGSFAHCWSSFDMALELMAKGIIDVQPLVSAIVALDQWKAAFERLENCDAAKILLTPPASSIAGS